MYRCLDSFSPKKILEGETALLANKPRRDFPDFRSILPGFWERWAHSLLLECLPHLLPCLAARACWYHGSMPKAAGIAPAIPVMLPLCRSHIQLNHCSSSLAPFHWTEFGLNFVFSLPHLPQRAETHLPGWSDGENLFVTCCTIAEVKEAREPLMDTLKTLVSGCFHYIVQVPEGKGVRKIEGEGFVHWTWLGYLSVISSIWDAVRHHHFTTEDNGNKNRIWK